MNGNNNLNDEIKAFTDCNLPLAIKGKVQPISRTSISSK
jgi:hypothetical protein